ncbi:MAG TPA: hypothetical protein VF796_22100, partial [Humisphaera sp.]
MTSYRDHDDHQDDANKRAAGANGGRGTNGTGASYRTSIADATEIERAMRAVLAPGQVTEVRALDAVGRGDRRAMTYSGYFDDPAALAAAVAATLVSAKGVYFVPNPVHPGLLARAVNRLRPAGKNPTTSDGDVTGRRWLLVDLDPARPSGISATDAEHDAALDRAGAVARFLSSQGWPDPVEADSGNGGHLMYRVDLPADDGGLVERCLRALDARFGDDAVHVDTTTFNPARIWKLYGTRAGKGDDAGEACGRPHRVARVLRVPPELQTVTREQLEALAGPGPDDAAAAPAARPKGPRPANGRAFDVATWLGERGVAVSGPTDWPSRGGIGKRWVLEVCPWDQAHTNGSAYVVQFPSGAVEAGCHHNGCAGRGWHDLRDRWEPGWRDRRGGADGPRRTIGGPR